MIDYKIYSKLMSESTKTISKSRRIDRLLKSDRFYSNLDKFKKSDVTLLTLAIQTCDEELIKHIIREAIGESDLGDLSLRRLRQVASHYKVRYYTRLPKAMLINEIQKKKEEEDDVSSEQSRSN